MTLETLNQTMTLQTTMLPSAVICKLFTHPEDEDYLGICRINFTADSWSISQWYVSPLAQHQGIGSALLRYTSQQLQVITGTPQKVQYIWNGANEYVGQWIKTHFDAKCLCPIAIQKYDCSDNWESHTYNLDTAKYLAWMNNSK